MKSRSPTLRKHKNDLGKFVKDSRKAKHMSLDDLAKFTGLSRSYLGDIEAGRKGFSLPAHTISLLSQALDVSQAQITLKMVKNDFEDTRKYGEYYRVLRSNVRAGQIARYLQQIRDDVRRAKDATLLGKDIVKILQGIENTVQSIDNTLAYRGKPPVSVQPGRDKGDDEKFLDGRIASNEK